MSTIAPEISAPVDRGAPVPQEPPFGVNEMRLTGREWIATLIIFIAFAIIAPRAWKYFESFHTDRDYRLPYVLSKDYWLFERRLQQISDAHPVTDDPALIEPLVLTSQCLVSQLRQFNQAIKAFDHKIKALFKAHPDHALFESLPGAGEQLAPRLLSLFGSDRSRWADATELQKYSGIAPVIERSGKSLWVHRRLSRPKFICQTFHEFAQQSIQRSSWAARYYQRQRERGKTHHSAIRSLA